MSVFIKSLRRVFKAFLWAYVVGSALAGCAGLWDFKGPEVLKTVPSDGEVVDPSSFRWVKIYFSEPMDRLSTESAVSITPSLENVPVWESPSVLSLKINKKPENGIYYLKITTGAKDINGNSLIKNYLFKFQVGKSVDAPRVISTFPVDGQSVAEERCNITVVFSKPMDRARTEKAFSVSPALKGYFKWESPSGFTYVATEDLSQGKWYTVTIGNEASDKDGNTLGDAFKFSFFAGKDYIQPEVLGVFRNGDNATPISSRYWSDFQHGVEKNWEIAVHFSEPMDENSAQEAFQLSPPVEGYFYWLHSEGEIMVFHPLMNLQPETLYTLRISSSAKDASGLPLKRDFIIRFYTDGSGSRKLRIVQIVDSGNSTWSEDQTNLIQITGAGAEYVLRIDFSAPVDIVSFQSNFQIRRIAGNPAYSTYSGSVHAYSWSADFSSVNMTIGELAPDTFYQIVIPESVKDMNENSIDREHVYVFKARL